MLRAYASAYPEQTAQAVYRTAQGTLNKSAELVPVDKGILRGSRYITEPEIGPGRIGVSMGYATDYAAAVHERLDAAHNPPTQAKYLEAPLLQDLPEYPRAILRTTEKLVAKEVAKHAR